MHIVASSQLNSIKPNNSNKAGSFTMANSDSFFGPYKILPIAQDNKYLGEKR